MEAGALMVPMEFVIFIMLMPVVDNVANNHKIRTLSVATTAHIVGPPGMGALAPWKKDSRKATMMFLDTVLGVPLNL